MPLIDGGDAAVAPRRRSLLSGSSLRRLLAGVRFFRGHHCRPAGRDVGSASVVDSARVQPGIGIQ